MAIVADKTIVDTVNRQVADQANAIIFQFEGRQTTFAQFDRNSNKVANALIASGIKAGDHIAYLGKNSDHYFELMIGAMKMGAITTPVNWRLAPPEVIYIVNDSEAPILFVGPELTALAPFEADGLIQFSPTGLEVTSAGRLFIRNIAMCFDNTLAPSGERKYSRTI